MISIPYVKATNPHSAAEAQRFEHCDVAHTPNGWDERHTPPKHLVVDPDQYLVRRLTPRECERLQGFPDDFTLLPAKKPADGPRYKALGNSMAVPVMAWIGRQIEFVHRFF
ncbi:MAG: DNA cytosine methyltransferase [Hydrogenophaga sp.]|nr:DNA cytosine methyltransferase [Hydrogenophaga sp.]